MEMRVNYKSRFRFSSNKYFLDFVDSGANLKTCGFYVGSLELLPFPTMHFTVVYRTRGRKWQFKHWNRCMGLNTNMDPLQI